MWGIVSFQFIVNDMLIQSLSISAVSGWANVLNEFTGPQIRSREPSRPGAEQERRIPGDDPLPNWSLIQFFQSSVPVSKWKNAPPASVANPEGGEPDRVADPEARLVGDRQRQAAVGEAARRRVHPVALGRRPAPIPARTVGPVLLQKRVVRDLVHVDLESWPFHRRFPQPFESKPHHNVIRFSARCERLRAKVCDFSLPMTRRSTPSPWPECNRFAPVGTHLENASRSRLTEFGRRVLVTLSTVSTGGGSEKAASP